MIHPKTVPDGNALSRASRLFDDVEYQCHRSHMMALALETVFEHAVPIAPNSAFTTTLGYVALTVESRELLSLLVNEIETCSRLAKKEFTNLAAATEPWRRQVQQGSANHG